MLVMLNGGKKLFGLVSMWLLKVLAMLKGGSQNVSTLYKRRGCKKFYPVLGGGGEQKVLKR